MAETPTVLVEANWAGPHYMRPDEILEAPAARNASGDEVSGDDDEPSDTTVPRGRAEISYVGFCACLQDDTTSSATPQKSSTTASSEFSAAQVPGSAIAQLLHLAARDDEANPSSAPASRSVASERAAAAKSDGELRAAALDAVAALCDMDGDGDGPRRAAAARACVADARGLQRVVALIGGHRGGAVAAAAARCVAACGEADPSCPSALAAAGVAEACAWPLRPPPDSANPTRRIVRAPEVGGGAYWRTLYFAAEQKSSSLRTPVPPPPRKYAAAAPPRPASAE